VKYEKPAAAGFLALAGDYDILIVGLKTIEAFFPEGAVETHPVAYGGEGHVRRLKNH
jgi:hypothetical protein